MSNKPKNVILIVGDSLRYSSVYQDNDIQMPYFQDHAHQFHQARSSGCWTLPATSSMFTGLMPHEHGATSQTRRIHSDVATLAEKMKAAGYSTHQVTANVVTTEVFGLDRGFDEVRKIWQSVPAKFNKLQQFLVLVGKPRLRKMLLSKDAVMLKLTEDLDVGKAWLQILHQYVFDEAKEIIAQNEAKGKGSFIFINLMETHFPYHVADTFNVLSDSWWNKIREVNTLFNTINQTFLKTGKLNIKKDMLDILRQRQRKSWEIIAGRLNNFAQELHEDKENLVIFCGDHGDNFGEDGWLYHFSNVTEAGNHVPLLWLDHQKREAKNIHATVNAKDIHNSILKACGFADVPSLVESPETSISVMQSYWYNNHGKTLDQYKYNQICFVNNQERFLYRRGLWFAKKEEKEKYEALSLGTSPLEENNMPKKEREKRQKIFKNFELFSQKVGNGK